MEVKVKNIVDMTPLEYAACLKATYGRDGYMWWVLRGIRLSNEEGQAVMLWDGPEDDMKSLIGWALVTRSNNEFMAEYIYTTKAKYAAMFWVKRQYRRLGHGKKLMLEVKKIDSKPYVFPHDIPSRELFASFSVTMARADRHSMSSVRRKPIVA